MFLCLPVFALICATVLAAPPPIPPERRVYTTNFLEGFKKDMPSIFPPGLGGRDSSTRAILDIGANNGDDYTIRGYRAGHPVVAFEPSPIVNSLFRRVMEKNKVRVAVVNVGTALAPITNGYSVRLVIPTDATGVKNSVYLMPVALSNKTGITVLHESPCANLIKCGKVNHIVSGDGNVDDTKVQMYRLDDVILPVHTEKIWFMKIDVEGHELEVLQGARMTLTDSKTPYIAIEFSANARLGIQWGLDLLDQLFDYGYTCYHLRGFGSCHDAKLRSPSLSCNYPFSTTDPSQAPTFEEYARIFEVKPGKEKEKPRMSDLMCALSSAGNSS